MRHATILKKYLKEKPEVKSDIFKLTIVYQEDNDEVAGDIDYSWHVVNVTNFTIDFQLLFEDFLLISTSQYDKHSVKV